MESDRVLRPRRQTGKYFPKQRLYTVVAMEEGANYQAATRRRSKSVDQEKRQQPAARRVHRSQSVDQSRITGRRVSRAKPNAHEERRDTFSYMAEANAMLTGELIKTKEELDAKIKKIASLINQDVANQKLIKDCQEKDDEIDRLRGYGGQTAFSFDETLFSAYGDQFEEISVDSNAKSPLDANSTTSSTADITAATSRLVIAETFDAEPEYLFEEWLEDFNVSD